MICLVLFSILILNGCIPSNENLQTRSEQLNSNKTIYIKYDTNGYDSYDNEKKISRVLKRGERYSIIDEKDDFFKLTRYENLALKDDIWILKSSVESEKTYFVRIDTNVKNATITLNDEEYKDIKRVAKGTYNLTVSAKNFLTKKIELIVDGDIQKEIILEKDQKKLYELRIKKEKINREKFIKELEKVVYIDNKQKLMWQDNVSTIEIKKPWLTKINFESNNYDNTEGDTASNYCKNLKLGNYKDWKLPSKEQLKNLFIQKSNLKNVSLNWYWSNTTSSNNSQLAWSVHFENNDGFTDSKNDLNFVRCVRDLK